jgi:hypothetical protein
MRTLHLYAQRTYNGWVSVRDASSRSAALSRDTSAAIEQRQIEAWRRMSPAEKLRLVSDATQAVIDLSFAGIRRRHPVASDRECFLRFACIALGQDVARTVYPDLAHLTDPRP